MRFWIPISLVAVLGTLISAAVAWRIYHQELIIEQSLLGRAVDAHTAYVQERMAEREVLAQVAAAMFSPPVAIARNTLQGFRGALHTQKADFIAVGWLPRVEPAQTGDALAALADNGVTSPRFYGPGFKPLDVTGLDRPMYPVIDVEPRTPENMRVLGLDAAAVPSLKAAIDAVAADSKPFATDPVKLVQLPDQFGVILYAPVYRGDGGLLGFVTFAYRIDEMLKRPSERYPFSVTLMDPGHGGSSAVLTTTSDGAVLAQPLPSDDSTVARTVSFGTRTWTLQYRPEVEIGRRSRVLATDSVAVGLAITCILLGLFGYVVTSNVRLNREVELRAGVEHRLSAVIRELNHRVLNMLSVIQSIVQRSLHTGVVADEAREQIVGRLHAMSHAVALLTETEWRGTNLRDLFSQQVMPASGNVHVEGPDIVIGARAAQALALMFYELTSNAKKYGALSTPRGAVNVRWSAGDGGTSSFHLHWEEKGGPPPGTPGSGGFGEIVLDRVAPEALRGTATRTFAPEGFIYDLEAPRWGLGDKGREE